MGNIHKLEHWVIVGVSEGRFYYLTKTDNTLGYEIMWPDMTYYGITLSKFHSPEEATTFLNIALEADKKYFPPGHRMSEEEEWKVVKTSEVELLIQKSRQELDDIMWRVRRELDNSDN